MYVKIILQFGLLKGYFWHADMRSYDVLEASNYSNYVVRG